MTTAEIRAQLADLIDQRISLDIQIARLRRRLEASQERIKLHIVGGGT